MELGRAPGLTDEQFDLFTGDGWRESEAFDDRERAVIRWAEAVTNRTAHDDDAAFTALRRHFDDREIVELASGGKSAPRGSSRPRDTGPPSRPSPGRFVFLLARPG